MKSIRLWLVLYLFVLLLASSAVISVCLGQAASNSAVSAFPFAPLDEWKKAIAGHNASALKMLYSATPPAQIMVPAGKTSTTLTADADVEFWMGLKARTVKMTINDQSQPGTDLQQIAGQIEILSVTPSGNQTLYVPVKQLWQHQGEQWRLIAAQRTLPARLQQPASIKKEIYRPGADAKAEIKESLEQASKNHKRVLLVFGANWCYDCHVLDLAFHRADLAPLLERNYVVLHVDVGEGDKNQDLMEQYQVPMKKGIPGLAVLDSDGKLLVSQKNGEFENARALAPEDLRQFLDKWKPTAR